MSAKPKVIRCAIYTRKSSEEGLEQEFNSLHAQREAGESYVKSQKHEGWEVLPTEYDDGGYSGGNTERPALKKLMADIEAKKIDIVVVYKVDRLSRSLGDFARIIEVFDKYNVSFVSVTQQFNTSTSMGRLTLNVLLSFAQFEREVTGERIRDKFAASKQKGMWLGGFTPLGYDVVNKKLIVNNEEAELVRYIFKRYLVLKSAYHLSNELNRDGIPTKSWINSNEKKVGGKPYTKNRVYKLITNPVYIGKVTHYQRKAVYDGIHEPIIDQVLWDQAQELLQRQQRSKGVPKQSRGTMLVKLLRAQDETPYVPTYTGKPNGKKYNYYRHEGTNHRVVANVIERLVIEVIRELAPPVPESMTEAQTKHRWRALWVCFAYLAIGTQNQVIRQIIDKIICSKTEITIRLKIEGLKALLQSDIFDSLPSEYDVKNETREIRQLMDVRQTDEFIDIMMEVNFVVKSGKHYIADADGQILDSVHKCEPNQAIIAALAKAHRWMHMIDNGKASGVADISRKEKIRSGYIGRILRLNYLSPKIKTAILTGRQPQTLKLQHLMQQSLPIRWDEQETMLGF